MGFANISGEYAKTTGQGYSGTSKGLGPSIGSNITLTTIVTHSKLVKPVDPKTVGSISEAVGIAP